MRVAWLCLLSTCTLIPSALAASLAWESAPERGELLFMPSYEGETLQGRFPDFEVELRLNESDGEPEALDVRVEVGGVDMQDEEANTELREPEWLDAGDHPVARFSSTRITQQSPGYLARGELEIRGIRRSLDLPFQLDRRPDRLILEGRVVLERSRWGVGSGEWAGDTALAENVEIRFRAILRPREEP